MKRIYVTGHKGYVGRELVRRGFLPLECDVRSKDDVGRAINKSKPDLLIHLASKSDVDYCWKLENENEVVSTNLGGTYNVFRTLAKLKLPGILMSSDQVWGGGYFETHKENSKLTPAVNFYGMSKVAAEAAVKEMDGNIIRTSYLFDKARLSSKTCSDYPVFIRRSFLHLQDFCDMLEHYCKLFYKMPKVLHLAGSETVSWYTFAKAFSSTPVKPRFFEKKGFAPRPWFGGLDIKLSEYLGFPQISYLDGIKRMKRES